LLNVAANQATLALLTDSARDEQRIADTLQRIGTALASELDPERVVQAVTDEATSLTGTDFGAFFYNVVKPAGESYRLYTLAGAPREAFLAVPHSVRTMEPKFVEKDVSIDVDMCPEPRTATATLT
jgi:GAF domain-containing protein